MELDAIAARVRELGYVPIVFPGALVEVVDLDGEGPDVTILVIHEDDADRKLKWLGGRR